MKSFQNWPGRLLHLGRRSEAHQPLLEPARLEGAGERLLDDEHDADAAACSTWPIPTQLFVGPYAPSGKNTTVGSAATPRTSVKLERRTYHPGVAIAVPAPLRLPVFRGVVDGAPAVERRHVDAAGGGGLAACSSRPHSAAMVGLLGLAQRGPSLLLTPIAGRLADQHDRRRLLAWSRSPAAGDGRRR